MREFIIVWFGKFLGFTLEERIQIANDRDLMFLARHGRDYARKELLKRSLLKVHIAQISAQ